jgi:hypothetical protein
VFRHLIREIAILAAARDKLFQPIHRQFLT